MLQVVTESYPDSPGLDTGISHAVVRAVGEGRLPEVFRIHRTGPIVAFGRQDRLSDGYRRAIDAARTAGYLPVERLAGGRAAVFHEGTLAFSWAIPDPEPHVRVSERFATVSGMLAEAFRDLGLDARIGAVPGEYCPGRHSVNIGGRVKVMGVGQRLVRGAAHVGGVIAVDGGRRIADVLRPVYSALEIDWDPLTAGDLCDFIPDIALDQVTEAVVTSLARRARLVPSKLPDAILDSGRSLAAGHVASSGGTA